MVTFEFKVKGKIVLEKTVDTKAAFSIVDSLKESRPAPKRRGRPPKASSRTVTQSSGEPVA
jgi:hypothetical protein